MRNYKKIYLCSTCLIPFYKLTNYTVWKITPINTLFLIWSTNKYSIMF